ncbi:DgyrCDS7931 [Dimorphilus gyrociliatus]|uniref:Innexin n=1 Tax=Dimorphilus gyrociliatus TaxID=2664684 RepID=A0A7I8VV24_9ANNE|nr:DgyrCDS7931 [Dimorphilus gyrociliatus]
MDKIIGVIGGIPLSKSRNDDTSADRLSHRFTSAILVVFAVVVSAKQFVGEPINCWVPAHFSGGWEEYTNSYCWIKNTYYLPFDDHIPKHHEHEKRNIIPYYQWVPIIFLVMALFFYLPTLIWRSLNNKSGIDIKSIVESAESFQNTEKIANRDSTLKHMTEQMHRYLNAQDYLSSKLTVSLKNCLSVLCVCCGRRQGTYLVSLYLVTKFFYILNALAQLFILDVFMGSRFHAYGVQVLKELSLGQDWTNSPRFPRVTMCDFLVRRLGNVQRYTVQCVLPINLFNEKLFLFIWWWIIFLVLIQGVALIKWILRTTSSVDNQRYIRKHLRLGGIIKSGADDKENVKRFSNDYLRPDGIFILRLIGCNTNTITVTDFVRSLWEKWIEDRNLRQPEKFPDGKNY